MSKKFWKILKKEVKMNNICYLVVPCYNEEEALPKSAPVFLAKVEELIKKGKISDKSKILFIDDGSKDKTWAVIEDLHKQNPIFTGLKLARNCGHEKALYGGLIFVKDKCDFAISLDADLQDDINAVDDFVEEYNKGSEVVFGCRKDRTSDSVFKKIPALTFYKLMTFLGLKIIPNHADYRLIAKRPLQVLEEYKEVNLFLRAVIADLGFKNSRVYYTRQPRTAGETKYSQFKLFTLAWEAITSFSVYPIRLISCLGFFIAIISLLMFAYFFIAKLLGHIPVLGHASVICSIWFLGGLQLLSIGVIGEYIGKTYLETKRRPRYIIEKYLE